MRNLSSSIEVGKIHDNSKNDLVVLWICFRILSLLLNQYSTSEFQNRSSNVDRKYLFVARAKNANDICKKKYNRNELCVPQFHEGYENPMLFSKISGWSECGAKSRFGETICNSKLEDIRRQSHFTPYRWHSNVTTHTWIWTWIKGTVANIHEKKKEIQIIAYIISI